MDKELISLIALNLVDGLGSRREKILLEHFGSARGVLTAEAGELARAAGIDRGMARRIKSAGRNPELEKELTLLEKEKIKVVGFHDREYPENLKAIYDPPIVLYFKGDLLPGDSVAVAVVGSRRPSYYGIRTAERLAYELSIRGITIVSGMARGIDTASHRGSLTAGGRTLAVLGSGLLRIYPPENERLAEKIAARGAVISEFPLLAVPLRQNFPRRNRIISGLSLGVVVVEAAERSGALITVNCALEQGREVFAVPGRAGTITSRGTNQLIQEGAKLVEGAEDVIEELRLTPGKNVPVDNERADSRPEKADEVLSEPPPAASVLTGAPLGEEAGKIFSLLGDEPAEIEDIISTTGLSPARVLSTLTQLEIKGFIRQLPGKKFVRK